MRSMKAAFSVVFRDVKIIRIANSVKLINVILVSLIFEYYIILVDYKNHSYYISVLEPLKCFVYKGTKDIQPKSEICTELKANETLAYLKEFHPGNYTISNKDSFECFQDSYKCGRSIFKRNFYIFYKYIFYS